MSSLHRTFPFRVRPLHRETLDSYTHRILAANFEPATLPADLVREARQNDGATADPQDWLSILAAKTNRPLHLDANPTGWCRHADSNGCEECIALIHKRWLCTRCAQGNNIEQYPHFDAPVCRQHHRWVGITTEPHGQHQVGSGHATAARAFTRLRNSNRLDARLYLTVSTALMKTSTPARTESEVFPAAVRTIAAITSHEFTSAFFDPTATFADTFAVLGKAIEASLGLPNARLKRTLWLYFRPTVAKVRGARAQQQSLEPTSPHEYPAAANIPAAMPTTDVAPQPFAEYLSWSRDTLTTASIHDLTHLAHLTADTDGRLRQFTCCAGHSYSSRLSLGGQCTSKCPACHATPPRTDGDLGSIAPHLAGELCPNLNGGLTARDISAASNLVLAWTCPHKHTYLATPANRTLNNSQCPVCSKRIIVAGINDLATTNATLAAEFHPSEYPHRSPAKFAAGSNTLILWLCAEGHAFRAPIVARASGQNCPTCTTVASHSAKRNLLESHPLVAAQWHPTRNYGRGPAEYTHGSRNLAWWICDEGHEFSQRIERRTAAGNGCPICSKRKLAPCINTLDATAPVLTLEWHPTRNKRTPSETMSIDKPYIWKCLAKGHEHMQTVDHRRKSGGCPICPREQRILTDSADESRALRERVTI